MNNFNQSKFGSNNKPLKVLMQNRSNAFSQWGGDTVLMERLRDNLTNYNVEVTIDVSGSADPSKFDLVHVLNFALPEMTNEYVRKAKEAGVPVLVTTLCEDIPNFHNQSIEIGKALIEYVNRGQDAEWWKESKPDIDQIQPAPAFAAQYAADNASVLIANGEEEVAILKRTYGDAIRTSVVKMGFTTVQGADPELFINEYGVRDFILCVGRLETRKNQLMLLKALEDSELPVVLMAGSFSYQPEYEAAVRKFKRKGQTLIVGKVSDEMLASAYAAAKVHALPSWCEFPGMVSLEAAYHGCNVVATRRGTLIDHLKALPFYCEPESESSISNAVIAAYYSPYRSELRDVVSKLTWGEYAANYRKEYDRLVGAREVVASSARQFEGADSNFEEIVTAGEDAAKSKDFDTAHTLLARAEQLNANSVRALKARGATFLAQGRPHEAEPYFERALKIDSNDIKVVLGMGMSKMAHGNPKDAYSYFVQALRIEPTDLMAILQLVECSYKTDRFDDLEGFLRGYVAMYPEDLEMRYCLAGARFKLGETDAAESLVDQVIAENPGHLGAKQLKEVIQESRASTPAKSLSDSVQVTETPSPKFDEIDTKISQAEDAKHRRQFEEALYCCKELLKRPSISQKQREQVLLISAEIAVLDGRLDEAAKIYDGILAQNPDSARAMCGKGALAANSDNWEVARELFQKAEQVQPGYDVAQAGMGLYWSYHKEPEKAWACYQNALKKNPENARALLGIIELGYPLQRLGDVETAIIEYLDMHPGDLDFMYSLAGCYYAQNKHNEALTTVNKIELFDPQHGRARELKEMILSVQGSPNAPSIHTP